MYRFNPALNRGPNETKQTTVATAERCLHSMSSWEPGTVYNSLHKRLLKQEQGTQLQRKLAQVWKWSSYPFSVYLGSNYNFITIFISRASFYEKQTKKLNLVEAMCLQNGKCPVAGGNNKCFLIREGLEPDSHLPLPKQEKRASKFKQDVWKPINIININTSEVFYRLWKGHDKNSFVVKLNALA